MAEPLGRLDWAVLPIPFILLILSKRLRSSSVSLCLRVDPSRRKAFTLIEVLVVLAVIAVLAALLLPVMAGARSKAWQTACAANLRQLAQANNLYAADHDGCFAPAAPGFFESDARRWFGARGADGRFEPRDGPLVPYLRDGGALRQCPGFQSGNAGSGSIGFDQGTGGYVYNYLAVGGRVWRLGYVPEAFEQGMNEANLPKPAETAMFADGALDIGRGLAEYGFMTPPPAVAARIYGATSLDPAIHFRHHERANVVFVDGHIHALTRVLSAELSSAYPGARPAVHGLGWFGPVTGDTFYDAD
jgi:prepilin-type N-terminal cleavage/methylation domain-containing protein/prepilin-type processing-associated H-X9-DG protein